MNKAKYRLLFGKIWQERSQKTKEERKEMTDSRRKDWDEKCCCWFLFKYSNTVQWKMIPIERECYLHVNKNQQKGTQNVEGQIESGEEASWEWQINGLCIIILENTNGDDRLFFFAEDLPTLWSIWLIKWRFCHWRKLSSTGELGADGRSSTSFL